jgi:hypothetical protein
LLTQKIPQQDKTGQDQITPGIVSDSSVEDEQEFCIPVDRSTPHPRSQ